ncbi:ribosomal protein L23, putative [Babesia bigemina]|uniref:Large ribosomal subunit protein uL23m n=1 Tax=Babesia bigemina TaxID=5866 RepID=A0A061D3S0_BABBI|nr:ribosomal protein L23, putative [Babesia bigemina]CDR94712.1 ribosomal protein L23, putative [Babesia bigemina]|eukprot:XP_012766898.1 ribosomal protein L23, putative [Babesia bigemina]
MSFLSRILWAPPKSPRNIYFPWQTMCVHRSGAFLERNRLALRVPINLTKFEIREYLRKLYGAQVIKVNTLIKVPRIKRDLASRKPKYYRNGPMYKKAIVTLEHAVPDEVKMLGRDFELGVNPAITKKNVHYGKKKDFSYLPDRRQDPLTGEIPYGWRLPIANLLADDDWEMHPELRDESDHLRMSPDPTEPHVHGGAYTGTKKPEIVPEQTYTMINLTPWRRKLQRQEAAEKDAVGPATPTPWRFPKEH